jgi:hypothetical protein
MGQEEPMVERFYVGFADETEAVETVKQYTGASNDTLVEVFEDLTEAQATAFGIARGQIIPF